MSVPEDLPRLKTERTQLKLQVTNAAKRLKSAISRNIDSACIQNFMFELERCMADFEICHEEFVELIESDDTHAPLGIVNGLDLAQYKAVTEQTYTGAIELYKMYKSENEQSDSAQDVKMSIPNSSSQSISSTVSGALSSSNSESSASDSSMAASAVSSSNPQSSYSLVHSNDTIMTARPHVSGGSMSSVNTSEFHSSSVYPTSSISAPVPPVMSAATSYYQPINSYGLVVPPIPGVYGPPASAFLGMPSMHNPVDTVSGSQLRYSAASFTPGGVSYTPGVSAFHHAPTDLLLPQNSQMNFGRSELNLKKFNLPDFSGLRKDWPEFKTVWRELAERNFQSKSALAYELKRCLKGQAKERVKNVYITKPEAYDIIWQKLSEFYDDVSASVQSALDGVYKLKPVREDDYKAIVRFVDEVEATYSQLEELGHLDLLSLREIDKLADLLPSSSRRSWMMKHHELPHQDKVKPLKAFMQFLNTERAAVLRLAETGKSQTSFQSKVNTATSKSTDGSKDHKSENKPSCAVHRSEKVNHKTADCRDFKSLSIDKRYEVLREVHACFGCFEYHRRDKCKSKVFCNNCRKGGHNTLLCRKNDEGVNSSHQSARSEVADITGKTVTSNSNAAKGPSVSFYAIQQVHVASGGRKANIFCDNGSDTTYITHKAADRLHAKKLAKYTLDVTTMGNKSHEYDTRLYELSLRTVSGKIVSIEAFGIEEITGPVSMLDLHSLSRIFPDRDVSLLQRKSSEVDILLGCDYFGLHPKQEVCIGGENLSIMQGELGMCLQGSHPFLQENTKLSSHLVKVVHDYRIKVDCNFVYSHAEFVHPSKLLVHECNTNSAMGKSSETEICNFIQGEELATQTVPKCGGCKCSKCPSIGHTYSFREEQELKMIQENLRYDPTEQCWYTSYPWLADPSQLPDNYGTALATLANTERTLSRDAEWATKYCEQIQDMVDRNVARKLSAKELESWKGPKFYISHLAVKNPKSQSTPVRIVFNSSQVCKGVSLNSVLAKGPDCYLNNLIGLLLRWREENIAAVGDIKKMFNSVYLEPTEQHTHRFLWRDLDVNKSPDVYVIQRVNMGDKPAPAIATEAIYLTAERFESDSVRAANVLRKSTYVDDILDSFPNRDTTLQVVNDTESMLAKGGFFVKCWQISGDSMVLPGNASGNKVALLKGSEDVTRVLGVAWLPQKDVITFQVSVNFSQKRRGERTGQDLQVGDLPQAVPVGLTRRMVLEQVMSIFDPLGLLSPFTLTAKMYLRETWSLKLGWDEPMPETLRNMWLKFFVAIFDLTKLEYDRKLKPPNAVGKPWLVILSDGSDNAYGFAAYIRWVLDDGQVWCRLIMAKCRIAPLQKISTPQMELNAAVLSKRGRKVIEKEMRFPIDRVLHLVDSETVLNMVNKTSTRFKVYEGVRIGEIQAATGGDMSEWAWVSGKENTADWLTRGRVPKHLDSNSDWWNGPSFLYESPSSWNLKFGLQKEVILPGEKKVVSTSSAVGVVSAPLIDYSRFSSVRKIYRVIARILSMLKSKSFRGGNSKSVTPDLLLQAEKFVLLDVQGTMDADLTKKKSKYFALKPVLNSDGLWVIGKRLSRFNPMTPENDSQILLPNGHVVTRLVMRNAHEAGGHRGRDATLARFRQRFWMPQGSKVAYQVRNACQLCKLRDVQFSSQEMGLLPEARLKPAPPFTKVMLDLFGPYTVRGEVNKRVSSKAYGVLFTDMAMRAVHIEGVFGYDTASFLMALSRFVSIRGWPETIFSDPGSQLVCVSKELQNAWEKIDRTELCTVGSENGVSWVFGPADSPWHQGAVESLVKAAKRAFDFTVHNQRLSPTEFLTISAEVSNLLNERPIGVIPGSDSEISLLTPNSLLLGRATAQNPRCWQPQNGTLIGRYQLVQKLVDLFWQKWTELCVPGLVVQRKWHTAARDLRPRDVVIVADKNSLRGCYRLGVVKEVFPGIDGRVRKVSLTYKNFRVGEKVYHYSGAPDTIVTRSVQRLALLVPVDS